MDLLLEEVLPAASGPPALAVWVVRSADLSAVRSEDRQAVPLQGLSEALCWDLPDRLVEVLPEGRPEVVLLRLEVVVLRLHLDLPLGEEP